MMRLTIAQAAGAKRRGGGELRLADFLPAYAAVEDDDDDPTGELKLMAEVEAALAKKKPQ